MDSLPAMIKSYELFWITATISLATWVASIASVFTRIALSAPMANAFLRVGSVSAPPTLITSTSAPSFSFNHMARVKPNSSFGLIMYCTPAVSNFVSFSTKLIFEVVSGTWLIHTSTFISFYLGLIHFSSSQK